MVGGNGTVVANMRCGNGCGNDWWWCGCEFPVGDVYNAKGEVLLYEIEPDDWLYFYKKDGKRFFINDKGEFVYTDFEFAFKLTNEWKNERLQLDRL